MHVSTLSLANVRAVANAEFQFRPGFNLIVGVNGVGKSTVLDALRVGLSGVLAAVPTTRLKLQGFDGRSDIRVGQPTLSVQLRLDSDSDRELGYDRHQQREHIIAVTPGAIPVRPDELPGRLTRQGQVRRKLREAQETKSTRDRGDYVPSAAEVRRALTQHGANPIAVYFSTRRAVTTNEAPSTRAAAGGIAAAYAGTLDARGLNIGEFSTWLRSQQVLQAERAASGAMLAAFERVVQRFLPGYSNIRVELGEQRVHLMIDRGGTTIDVAQLSDGERGLLAIVLDLTRRLAQANPGLGDPAQEASAVVLIDEIDLHLHPRWQREVARNLTDAFPRCQFIATTHSPQVIGEIPQDRIQILTNDMVYSPAYAFGVDTNRVLEEVMDTAPRTQAVQNAISNLSHAVDAERYEDARAALGGLAQQLGENDPEVIRARTLLEFLDESEEAGQGMGEEGPDAAD